MVVVIGKGAERQPRLFSTLVHAPATNLHVHQQPRLQILKQAMSPEPCPTTSGGLLVTEQAGLSGSLGCMFDTPVLGYKRISG